MGMTHLLDPGSARPAAAAPFRSLRCHGQDNSQQLRSIEASELLLPQRLSALPLCLSLLAWAC